MCASFLSLSGLYMGLYISPKSLVIYSEQSRQPGTIRVPSHRLHGRTPPHPRENASRRTRGWGHGLATSKGSSHGSLSRCATSLYEKCCRKSMISNLNMPCSSLCVSFASAGKRTRVVTRGTRERPVRYSESRETVRADSRVRVVKAVRSTMRARVPFNPDAHCFSYLYRVKAARPEDIEGLRRQKLDHFGELVVACAIKVG